MSITGAFYFKQTSSGNLFGEFMDEHSSRIETECSTLLVNNSTAFIGRYYTTWIDNGRNHTSELTIEANEENPKVLLLKWIKNGILKYSGEGFICDEKLIGYYRA